ncbi:Vps5-domain-containing protein [Coniophora puteana RWD-64-598 SS2]|uniref:Vps5-domain-containing protein n=1 Tax=Coniophora puteana (strain RWD-64-598) TaxID=741705 RepID=A0A5M3MJK3_CONPW|nr:Vps5-domain-containing protein [Coniophora puteana RWD-64-598 SS2]EIW79392.1 Vps5-domain-containing protein [Coniophora puteana RWD-64-598 SS2]
MHSGSDSEEDPGEEEAKPELAPEPKSESPSSPAETAVTPTSSPRPETPKPTVPETSGAVLPSTPSTASSRQQSVERAVVSPLDSRPAIHNSFASLAIGGESHGGWDSGWGSHSSPVAPTAAGSNSYTDDDDDDDDKPIGQNPKFRNSLLNSAPHSPAPQSPASASHSRNTSANINVIAPAPFTFSISVEDPQKVGDPIRSFTLYTVTTQTNSTMYEKTFFSVLRRYSDFLWLYETLSMNNPGVVVPPVPGKTAFGRFDEHFVQQRRLALEKCIQKMASHPVLQKDRDLKFFLESDNFALDVKHRRAEISQERGGLIASIGATLTGPRFHETDEWFDRQKAYLDGLEIQLKALVKAIETVAKHRVDMASATGEFATTIHDLSQSEVGRQLQSSLAGMHEVQCKSEEIQKLQSQADIVTLMSTADEYSRLINSVRLAFNSRIRTYVSWQNADADARRVRQAHERSKVQGRSTFTVNQIAEAERRALDAKHEYDQCSRLIKIEVARFETERVEDFKNCLQTFLDGMIARQKELIASWENYQQQLLARVHANSTNGNGTTAITLP